MMRDKTMCGIVGQFNYHKSNKYANDDVAETFEDQRKRGTDGFGIVFLNKDKKVSIKRAVNELKMQVDLAINKSKMIMLHHRIPTSSANRTIQTHPIFVENDNLKYNYLMIHNGIISNCDDLKELHEKEGYKYTTEEKAEDDSYSAQYDLTEYNDSESLAIELARYIEWDKKKNKEERELRIEGRAAFIIMQIDKETNKGRKVYFGKNEGSPLMIETSKASVKISSENNSKKANEVKDNKLYSFGLENFNLKKEELIFKKEKIEKVSGTVLSKTEKDKEKEEEENEEADNNVLKAIEEASETKIEESIEKMDEQLNQLLDDFRDKLKEKGEAFVLETPEWGAQVMRIMIAAQKECEEIHTTVTYEQEEYKERVKEMDARTECETYGSNSHLFSGRRDIDGLPY